MLVLLDPLDFLWKSLSIIQILVIEAVICCLIFRYSSFGNSMFLILIIINVFYMLINKTNKLIIANDIVIRKSFFSKLKGLMFSGFGAVEDKAHIFVFNKPILVDIHMFFVFYPIDVVFLDSKSKVVELKENFLPFTFYFSTKKSKFFIELKQGSIFKNNICLGDKLSWNC